jgi:hypothetical protein
MVQPLAQDRQRPESEHARPAAREREHERQAQRNRRDRPKHHAVTVGRGAESDMRGRPVPDQRGQGRLCDGEARSHDNGHDIEESCAAALGAHGAACCRNQEAEGQRAQRTESGDDERAGHGRDRKQHNGESVEEADLGAGHIEVFGEKRQDGRDGEERDTHASSAQPEEGERPVVLLRQSRHPSS